MSKEFEEVETLGNLFAEVEGLVGQGNFVEAGQLIAEAKSLGYDTREMKSYLGAEQEKDAS